ncbi:hypothetical protein ACN28I_21995 [Archangium gephyra]|uniref:hypothetical protein n=1 Tax=Archangium gephyra TaxID=48 RepID=UPI003B7ADE0F
MSAPLSPPLEALRRQLEGRWEHIERARERYTLLTRHLASFQWQSALRSRPELLKETREQEAKLSEVLTYVEHRASREQWPQEHPGLRVLKELRSLRAELEALAGKRLAQASPHDGASLVEALDALEALALALPPRPPDAEDPVLFEDWMLSWPSPGQVWLTPKRLLWQPWFGEPVQLPLAALEPAAITLLPGWIGVRVKRKGLTLFSLSYSETLASLIRLGVRSAHPRLEQPQVHDVVTHLAYVPRGDSEAPRRWGLGVFGPHGVALLPARHRTLLDLCRSLVGLEARRPQDSELRRLEAVVEHLRLLPPDEYTQALRELTHARGGRFWPSTERPLRGLTGQDVTLQAGKQRLVVTRPEYAVRQFLERHPPASSRPPKQRWWRKHKVRVGIAAGLALYYMSFMGVGIDKPLGYAGWALFAWACMSFSKDKGYSVLPGLLVSIFFPLFACFPWVLLFVLGSPKEES